MKRFASLLMSVLASTCSEPPTVEQLITSEIREMEAQIEAGERLNFMRHVADDFRGQGGALSRDELRAHVVLQFNRYQNLEARLLPITVREITESEATAEFRALLTGGAGWIPEDGQLYRFNTHWRLDGEDWMLVAADWEAAPIGELIE